MGLLAQVSHPKQPEPACLFFYAAIDEPRGRNLLVNAVRNRRGLSMATLTKQQLRLRAEIEEIASAIAMDHWNIKEYPPEARTPLLTKMKNQLVRSEVILKYTLIDEFL